MRNKKRTVSSKGYDQHREGPTVLLSADDAEIAIEHFYSTTQRVRTLLTQVVLQGFAKQKNRKTKELKP